MSRIKAEIEQKNYPNDSYPNTLTFGQTWLISGWVTEQNEDPETIAKSCYQALFKDEENQQRVELSKKGTFLKADIWEIERLDSQSYPQTHVIVALFPNQEMAEQLSNFYAEMLCEVKLN